MTETGGIGARVAALDWPRMEADLAGEGFATTGPLLSPSECAELVAAYDESPRFRSRVVMERHGYGRGEYQYFGYPLPAVVAALRDAFYRRLTPVANRWMEQHQVREEYRTLGKNLEQSCDQLRDMVRQTQQLRDRDQALQQDRDRLRELDRLQDRLRDMDRTMTQAHDALQKMVGKT